MGDRAGTRREHALALLLLAAAVVFLYGAALSPRPFQTHEALHPYARVEQLLAELHRGHVPQSFPDAVEGLGSAFPRYYPPLPYAVATALAAACRDPVLGTNLAFFAAALLGALAAYAALHAVTRDPWLAFGGALLAVAAPYRLAQVFVRGALAESWSLVFHPLALLGVFKTLACGRPAWHLPLAVAALLLTHQLTLPWAAPLGLALAALAWRAHGPRAAARLVAAAALGAGLAAFFLLPQQAGLGPLRVSDAALMGATPEAVSAHRVRAVQLVEPPRPERWWGLSRPEPEPDGMSFAVGWGPILALPLALAAGLGRRRAPAHPQGPLAAALLGASALVLAFAIGPRPWLEILPGALAYVQFPWRLLGLAGLWSAMAVALLAGTLERGRVARLAMAALGAAAVVAVPGFERRPLFAERGGADTGLGLTVQGEYLPRAFEPAGERPSAPRIAGGRILRWSRDGADVTVEVDAPRGGELVLPLFHFDFYRAWDGAGVRLPTRASGPWLAVAVPPGVAQVRIGQGLVPAAKVGLGLSALSLLLWPLVVSFRA